VKELVDVYRDEDDETAVTVMLTSAMEETGWLFPAHIRDWKYDVEAQTGWCWDEETTRELSAILAAMGLLRNPPESEAFVVEPSQYFGPNGEFLRHVLITDVEKLIDVRVGPDKRLWRYDRAVGVFKPDGEPRVRAVVTFLLTKRYYTSARVNEVVKFLVDRESFRPLSEEPDPTFINVRNGMLVWRENRVVPHDPSYGSTLQLPVHYRPSAECLKLDSYLQSVFAGPDDDADEVMGAVDEVLGYLLVPDVDFKTAFLFKGEGDSAKSTTLEVFAAFLGNENVSRYSLKELGERWTPANLFGKLLNISGDLSQFGGRDMERFMSIVGRDPMMAEHKFKDAFSFRPFVKLMMAANSYPWTPNQHDAYFNRFTVIPFPNRFTKGGPDWKERSALIADLTTPNEMAGLLNRALAGLSKLVERRRFDMPASWQERTAEYRLEMSSVAGFIEDRIELDDPDEFRPRSEFRSAYSLWCRTNDLDPVPASDLYGALETFGGKPHKRGVLGFKGIRLKEAPVVDTAAGLFNGAAT
jgi:putative DNA primase/helicase